MKLIWAEGLPLPIKIELYGEYKKEEKIKFDFVALTNKKILDKQK